MSYGLPTGTNIQYGEPGFPDWVYALADAFSLKPSTYPGHQEGDRGGEPGYAPNPQGLNRGIDFSGDQADMDRFARWCLDNKEQFEQVIWENAQGRRVGVAGGRDVSTETYFAADMPNHRDHVHLRVSHPIPLPGKEQPVAWTGDPVWLADVLKAYDGPKLRVRELPGWLNSGHGDMKTLWGVMIHHTGNGTEPAESIRRGRPDLPGPLAQLHIAADGTVTVVAAGVCWHAGAGDWPGIPTDMANWSVIGIECAWPMDTTITPATQTRERWPDAQIQAMRDTTAAILNRLGVNSSRVIGHKEWAGARQGKWDPGNLDMSWFRGEVAKAMRGDFKTARPIQPTPTPTPAPAPAPFQYPDSDQMLRQIWEQLFGPKAKGWPQLDGKTLVDAIAEVMKR